VIPLLTSCWFGFLIGLRHALDPDHLAAISTVIVDRPQRRRAAFLGACWGIGHSASLIGAGAVLLLCRVSLPDRAAELFELGVSIMLVALGVRSIRRSLRARRGLALPHAHDGVVHVHESGAGEEHFHVRSLTIARRPFLVGMVHGLAGTGAITALALASMPSASAALAYIGLFAIGSVAGMALLTGLAGVPIERLVRRPGAHAFVMAVVGFASLLIGVAWGAPILARLLPA
jgi:ABC-type nickel/cobalt efflux system permease component RcnA